MENLEIKWRCRKGTALVADSDDGVRLRLAGSGFAGRPMRFARAPTLLKLNSGVSELELAAAAGDDFRALAMLLRVLDQLRRRGLLLAEAHGSRGLLATLRPLTGEFKLPADAAPLPDRARWRLARFAWLRREKAQWLLECTEAGCDVLIEDAAVLVALHDAAQLPAEPEPVWPHFMGLLAELGFLDAAEREEGSAQRSWTFQDRLFHVHTRRFGALAPVLRRTDEMADETAGSNPPGELRPAHPGETIRCPAVADADSGSLADIMDRRRSMRGMGEPPVNLPAVAALLYRSVRVTRRAPGGFILRPYPSGGALHELEFYLAVRECGGLEPGFYHYRSDAHALTRLPGSGASSAAAAMIEDCAAAWNRPAAPPQCLIVIATRHPRVAWKYERIAYRLSLLSAGAAMQNFHLVATELGLHGCAAGSGRPELFARATGLADWEETSIGEFGFGSAAERD